MAALLAQRLLQAQVNVQVSQKRPLGSLPAVQKALAAVEKALRGQGRVLVRYSGTELLARVMLEGENEKQIRAMAQDIVNEIRAEVGA